MKHFALGIIALSISVGDVALANNLSSVYVHSVESAQGGWEGMSPWTSSTSVNHGGSWMYVVTEEIGYGSNAQAHLLGFSLREIRTEPLCNVRGQARPCNGRGTVIGYRRTWDASGRDGGNFQFMVIPNGIGGPRRVNLQIQ